MNDTMDQIWFIQIDGTQEGPFSALQLRYDHRITPNTLVWKKGWTKWIPLRNVPELQIIFSDEEPLEVPGSKKILGDLNGKEELAIDLQRDYPPSIFWFLLILAIIIYLYYRFQV